jgi:hypothetical protein
MASVREKFLKALVLYPNTIISSSHLQFQFTKILFHEPGFALMATAWRIGQSA